VNGSLGHHSVVLDLGLLNNGEVVSNEDDVSETVTESLHGSLATKGVLTRLDDESKLRVDGLSVLLNL